MVSEVPSVGRVVRSEYGLEVVIVAHVYGGVTEGKNRGDQRLRAAAADELKQQEGHQAAHAQRPHLASHLG